MNGKQLQHINTEFSKYLYSSLVLRLKSFNKELKSPEMKCSFLVDQCSL